MTQLEFVLVDRKASEEREYINFRLFNWREANGLETAFQFEGEKVRHFNAKNANTLECGMHMVRLDRVLVSDGVPVATEDDGPQ